ncbi:MAG: hypothetical protein IT405_03195 [Candidatus Yanofskybacteria bacterium]|nr:hypothetical protein [Candidatus Yanofskybacteria bacterium]
MNLWWLLWPLTGYLLWAWVNHIITVGFCQDGGYVKWLALCLNVLAGPIALPAVLREFFRCPREHRWGLRFR